jgi:FG-GAP-like repeat
MIARHVSGALLLLSVAATTEAARVPADFPTIQAAIDAVVAGSLPDGTIIEIAAGTYPEALIINSTGRSMTLRGAGTGATFVNATGRGQSALRILHATGRIRIEHLTFTGGIGVPGTGGGFTFHNSSPSLEHVVFEGNRGTDAGGGLIAGSHPQFFSCIIRNNLADRFGGGLVITTGSRPSFSSCHIRDNQSGTGGAGLGNIGSGGGVHINDASPTFRGCVITANRAKFAGGGIFHMGLFESGNGPALLLIEDTEVSNNVAERFSNADGPAEGGGVHIEDNAIAYLIRARIIGNAAQTGGGLNAYRARYEVTSSLVHANTAVDLLGIAGFGGGLAATSNNASVPLRQASSLILVDTAVTSNIADVGGGVLIGGDMLCGSPTLGSCGTNPTLGTLQVAGGLIASNTANKYSGGVRADRANVTLTDSHVLLNRVNANPSSYGGGMQVVLGSTLSMSNTTIARNSAAALGGGLFLDLGTLVDISGSRIYANTAASGGGLYVGNSQSAPSGSVRNSIIADNSARQIHEQACAPLVRTILTYQNNTITPRAGSNDIYFSTCGGETTSISAFNALPAGRASGNNSNVPSFATFRSTPDVGSAVLSWTVARATSVTVSGVGTVGGDANTAHVAPAVTTSYTLTANGSPAPAPPPVQVLEGVAWGGLGDQPVPGDYDGDGRDDLAVFRPSAGSWFLRLSGSGQGQQVNWGAAFGDVPVPADYDGDGRTDIGVYRLATGEWFILHRTGIVRIAQWGAPALLDTPVPADYDGDGRSDIAVFRGANGQWFILQSQTGALRQQSWGAPSLGDIPVPADYDGDNRADIGVYRQSTGQWFLLRSSQGAVTSAWGSGVFGDTPAASDYDGDGRTDLAVVRRTTGTWFITLSGGGVIYQPWGVGDARIPADYDGDGRDELAIWRAASGSWLARP